MSIKKTTSQEGHRVDSGILPTGKLAEKLANGGRIQPLEVMYDNMRFYEQLAAELEAFALREKPQTKELLGLMQIVVHLRKRAQACAVDAMPYVHPKLKANPTDPTRASGSS